MVDAAVDGDTHVGGRPAMRACEVAQAALFAAAQKAEISGLQARVEAAEHAGSSANSEPPAANLKCRNGSFACALNWT